MHRTYLIVPPEEKAEVQSLGAQWDNDTKCWYIDPHQPPAAFARWFPDANDVESPEDATFTIVSDRASVAAANVSCQQCNSNIEVICVYCESGTALDESLTQFTVSHVWAIDEELARQLRPWPNFRKVDGLGDRFANHCLHCDAPHDDLYLHTEPGDAFFDIPSAPPGSIEMNPLVGRIRLSGNEHFQVD